MKIKNQNSISFRMSPNGISHSLRMIYFVSFFIVQGGHRQNFGITSFLSTVTPNAWYLTKDCAQYKAGSIIIEFDKKFFFDNGLHEVHEKIEDDILRPILDLKILVMALRLENLKKRLKMLSSEQLKGLTFQEEDVVYVRNSKTSGQPIDFDKTTITKYSNGEVYVTRLQKVDDTNFQMRVNFEIFKTPFL